MSRWWVWWNCSSELFSWHSRRGAGPSCPGISCTASHYLLQLCCSRFLAIVKPTQDLANRCEKVGIVKVRYGGMVGLLINWLFPSLCLLYRVDPSNLPHPSMLFLFSTTMATKKRQVVTRHFLLGRCWHLGLTLGVDTYLNDIRFGRCQHPGSTLDVNTYQSR